MAPLGWEDGTYHSLALTQCLPQVPGAGDIQPASYTELVAVDASADWCPKSALVTLGKRPDGGENGIQERSMVTTAWTTVSFLVPLDWPSSEWDTPSRPKGFILFSIMDGIHSLVTSVSPSASSPIQLYRQSPPTDWGYWECPSFCFLAVHSRNWLALERSNPSQTVLGEVL